MSGHRSVLKISFVFFSVCFLHVCISKPLTASRPKRYTEEDVCHESQTTVKHVTVCHENIETLNKRSNEKNCSRYQPCAGQQLVYHCVRNGGGLVEVCAPRSLITGGFCAYYEKELGRVIENYRNRCKMCPFQYLSDNSFENSECVTSSVTNEDSSEQTSPANGSIHETKNRPCSTNNGTYFAECEGLKKKDSDLAIKVSRIKTEYETSKSVVMSGDIISKIDRKKHDGQIVNYIIASTVHVLLICLVVIFAYYAKKCFDKFCFAYDENQTEVENDLKTLCNDETYSETNEAMNLEEKNDDGIPVL